MLHNYIKNQMKEREIFTPFFHSFSGRRFGFFSFPIFFLLLDFSLRLRGWDGVRTDW